MSFMPLVQNITIHYTDYREHTVETVIYNGMKI